MKYQSNVHGSLEQYTQLIDIATRNVIRLSPHDPVGTAAQIMADKRISSIVLTDQDGLPIGIVTERNIIHAMQSNLPLATELREIMSAPVISVPETISSIDAYQLCIREGIRHLVIVDEQNLLQGVVSETDFRQHISLTALSGRRQVASLMNRSVFCLSPNASLQETLNLMKSHRDTCMVVVDNEFPIGIITERDIVRLYSSNLVQNDVQVKTVMTAPVLNIPLDSTVNQAAELMLKHKIRHLVVVDHAGRISGLLSEHDLTHTMTISLLDDKLISKGAFLHTLVKSIPDLVWLKDIHGVYLACNPRFEEFFGAKEKQIIGKTDYDFVDKTLADAFREQDRKVVEQDKPCLNEEWVTYAIDGHKELLETLKTPMRDNTGRLIGVLGIARNVTERKKRKMQLDQLNFAMDCSKELLAVMDENGYFLHVNETACRKLGFTREELLNHMTLQAIIPEWDQEKWSNCWQHLKSKGTSTFESLYQAKDGYTFPVEINANYYEYEANSYNMWMARDISGRKHLEHQLDGYRKRLEGRVAEETTKFHALVEQSLVGNYIVQDGVFRYVNSGFAQLFGYSSPTQMIGQLPIMQVVLPQDRPLVAENLRKRLSKETEHVSYSFTGIKQDGSQIVVDVHGRVIEYQGQPAVIGTLVDVTDIRRSQAELERLVDEKASELQRSEEKLRTLLEAIPDPIQFKDGNGRWLESNAAARKALGLEDIDCLGKTDIALSALAEPRFRAALLQCRASDEQTWQSGSVMRLEETVPLQDGQNLYFDVIKKPLFHEDSSRAGLVIVARDVTVLRNSKIALAEQEGLFKAIFNHAPIGIELVDSESLHFIEVNPAACQMMGYSHEEYLRLHLTDIQASLDVSQLNQKVQQIIATGAATFENRHRCKNGSILDIEINVHRIDLLGKQLLISVWKDITERKRVAQGLAAREREFRALVEHSPDNIARYDLAARILYINPTLEQTLDTSLAKIIGKTAVQAFPAMPTIQHYQNLILHVANTGQSIGFEQEVISANKKQQTHFIRMVPELDHDGKIVGVLAVGRDITEIKQVEENLRITSSVFNNSQEGVLITDANNKIVDVNPAFTDITGYSREEVLGQDPKLLNSGRQDPAFYNAMWETLNTNKSWRGEVWNRRKSGEVYAQLLSVSVICDDQGGANRYVGVFSDISYLKEHEAELSRVAHYDALTGIPNRVLLADRMRQAIAQTNREHSLLAVCYLDLDGFKSINDSVGHEAGDQVLIEVSQRIANNIRGGNTVARLGGDEFVVLLSLENDEECALTLNRLLQAIAKPILVKDKLHTVSASIGVSIYPLENEDSDTLLRHADQAMYIAKQSGKNCFYIYDPELDLRARNHNEFIKSIRHALQNGQFEMYYQPKINMQTHTLVGAEALIRWHHPVLGLLLPIEFLRPIENTECDIEIGNWVIASVLAQIERWHNDNLAIEISINISAYHLESPDFAKNLLSQLAQYPKEVAKMLQIEILETAALNDLGIVRDIIEQCRQLGVGFALDDFGTGYSSLSYLSRLPFDVLKIDQSFVRDMLDDKGDKTIIQGIIALAHAFERKIVAEGIETGEHFTALLEMGCEVGQGFIIARPMSAEELGKWCFKPPKGK